MTRTTVPPEAIDYFNRHHPLQALKARAALRARRAMYARVLELARPEAGTRILDVGTTPDLDLPYNNFFERWYPDPQSVTVCSIEDCSSFEQVFPGVTFRRITSDSLPFANREFDLALSFAVLEHVGDEAQQRHFVREMARVADRFILYTPYRYFPVEMHTFIPLSHWLPARWYRAAWARMGLAFWADERNLNLLSRRDIRGLLPQSGRSAVRLRWAFGCPAHLEISWTR